MEVVEAEQLDVDVPGFRVGGAAGSASSAATASPPSRRRLELIGRKSNRERGSRTGTGEAVAHPSGGWTSALVVRPELPPEIARHVAPPRRQASRSSGCGRTASWPAGSRRRDRARGDGARSPWARDHARARPQPRLRGDGDRALAPAAPRPLPRRTGARSRRTGCGRSARSRSRSSRCSRRPWAPCVGCSPATASEREGRYVRLRGVALDHPPAQVVPLVSLGVRGPQVARAGGPRGRRDGGRLALLARLSALRRGSGSTPAARPPGGRMRTA